MRGDERMLSREMITMLRERISKFILLHIREYRIFVAFQLKREEEEKEEEVERCYEVDGPVVTQIIMSET